jgi:hypothetical protein
MDEFEKFGHRLLHEDSFDLSLCGRVDILLAGGWFSIKNLRLQKSISLSGAFRLQKLYI